MEIVEPLSVGKAVWMKSDGAQALSEKESIVRCYTPIDLKIGDVVNIHVGAPTYVKSIARNGQRIYSFSPHLKLWNGAD